MTSLLKLTAENILGQLCSYFLDVKMSTADKDSQDCTMDLSQVEITDVSLKFVVYCVVMLNYGVGAKSSRRG